MSSTISLHHPETHQHFEINFAGDGQFMSALAYHGIKPTEGEPFSELDQLPEPIRTRVRDLVEIKRQRRWSTCIG